MSERVKCQALSLGQALSHILHARSSYSSIRSNRRAK